MAAVSNPEVDILAHPGLISGKEVELALENDVMLEISARKGHCLSNGHVGHLAMEHGARMLVNTDAHSHKDLITEEGARQVARGAGLPEDEVERTVVDNPREILRRIMGR
jgi:putative hydrolase